MICGKSRCKMREIATSTASFYRVKSQCSQNNRFGTYVKFLYICSIVELQSIDYKRIECVNHIGICLIQYGELRTKKRICGQ